MPDEPSKMIRVPTPLIDAVRELSRLHRAGRTKAVLEGVEKLVLAIDSEADVDIDSLTQLISRLTERLDKLEAQQVDSTTDVDIVTEPISRLTERLEKVESDIEALALSIQDLSVRISDLEGVGDIDGYTTSPLAELEALNDISSDSELAAEPPDQNDISSDIEPTAEAEDSSLDIGAIAEPEPVPQTPLTQKALAARLGASEKTIRTFRQKGKKSFAEWSRKYDPDGKAWTWEGQGGSGRSLRFVPWSTSPLP